MKELGNERAIQVRLHGEHCRSPDQNRPDRQGILRIRRKGTESRHIAGYEKTIPRAAGQVRVDCGSHSEAPMSSMSEEARSKAKSKAERLVRADPRERVGASGYTPDGAMNADVVAGMRPVSRRQFRRGGKVAGE